MTHPADDKRRVRVEPVLDANEIDLLRSLAGRTEVRRMWPGQPGARSPWVPCDDGCCLVAQRRPADDLTAWLRFLLRELLAPRAAASARRASALGLHGGHVLEGQVEVTLGAVSRLVVVRANRVQERAALRGSQRTER